MTQVKLTTNHGDIVIELNAEKAPITVANFNEYVKAGHYENTVFHRVIGNFMIQGGGFEPVKCSRCLRSTTGLCISSSRPCRWARRRPAWMKPAVR